MSLYINYYYKDTYIILNIKKNLGQKMVKMVKLLYITANLLKKVPPRQILKRNYAHAMRKISFCDKDAIGEMKK